MSKMTKEQKAYLVFHTALERLHETHFEGCDDISDVLGDDVTDSEMDPVIRFGEVLLEEILNTEV